MIYVTDYVQEELGTVRPLTRQCLVPLELMIDMNKDSYGNKRKKRKKEEETQKDQKTLEKEHEDQERSINTFPLFRLLMMALVGIILFTVLSPLAVHYPPLADPYTPIGNGNITGTTPEFIDIIFTIIPVIVFLIMLTLIISTFTHKIRR